MVECSHVRKYRLVPDCSTFHMPKAKQLWLCNDCDISDDLMGCLSCRYIGCDLYTGNSHARLHYTKFQHCLFLDLEAGHLFCFKCDGYVLNDNRSSDIARLKEYLALAKSTSGGRRNTRSCKSELTCPDASDCQRSCSTRPTTSEDPYTTSIWHRRVSLMLRMFRLWRKNLHSKLGCNELSFSQRRGCKSIGKLNLSNISTGTSIKTCSPKERKLQPKRRLQRGKPKINRKRVSHLSSEDASSGNSRASKKLRSRSTSLSSELRCVKGITGLINLGNTCYMNVVIQVLGHIGEFCDAICRMSLEYPSSRPSGIVTHSGRLIKSGLPGGSASPEAVENSEEKISTICQELHAVFNTIWSGLCPLYSPIGLRSAVSHHMSIFSDNEQHDAHEFLTVLLDCVHQEMVNTYGIKPSAVETCFEGTIAREICCRGGKCLLPIRFEKFQELDVNFPEEVISLGRESLLSTSSSYDLVDMLERYTSWEQFKCKCSSTSSQKRSLINTCPKVLRIHINRFCWISNPDNGQGCCKINWLVQFPAMLSLKPFCVQNGTDIKLRLCAVIVHDGVHFDRGHYHAYFLHELEGVWIRSSDKEMTRVSEDEVLKAQAYILFYQNIEDRTEQTASSEND